MRQLAEMDLGREYHHFSKIHELLPGGIDGWELSVDSRLVELVCYELLDDYPSLLRLSLASHRRCLWSSYKMP